VNCCCEKLVAEAGGQFGNPEERESPPLEAATKQLRRRRDFLTLVCVIANCKLKSRAVSKCAMY
jgi:hypothetical protein